MRKKILTLMLLVMLAATLLAGCGKDVETSGTAETKKIKEKMESIEAKESEDSKSKDLEEPKERTVLTRIMRTKPHGTPKVMYFAKYDAYGNKTEEYFNFTTVGNDYDDYMTMENDYDFFSRFPWHFPFILYEMNNAIWLEYDENGNIIRYSNDELENNEIDTYAQSDHVWRDMEYDASGNLVKCFRDSKLQYEWEYDPTGHLIKTVWWDRDNYGTPLLEYEGDLAGITKIIHYKFGSINYYTEYERDSAGNVLKDTRYDPDGSIGYYAEYERDSAGNTTKLIEYDSDGSVLRQTEYEYEYDSAGNITKGIIHQTDNTYSPGNYYHDEYEYEYEYDSVGNMTKYIVDSHNEYMHYEWEYDSAGNKTKRIDYWRDGDIICEYEYEYITITPATN